MPKKRFYLHLLNILFGVSMVLIVSACGSEPPAPTPSTSDEMLGEEIVVPPEEDESPSNTPDENQQYEGSVPAPSFPPDVEWINVEAPLTLADLKGKVVIMDFWTYGCINCIHMIPVLEELETKYADELVIISVHSAKFDTESETQNIQQVVQRYGITHPVINDDEFQVWQQYGAQAWPTFVLIDPNGNVLARDAGEVPFEAFDRLIGGMVAHFDEKGEIDREPLATRAEGNGDPSTLLRFPGKVLADAENERLFIADSNHHRIVIADLNTYEVLDVIGSGQRGFDDGSYTEATFNQPQGMALHEGTTLFVADTYNHAIREINLEERTVTTAAGTGNRGTGYNVPAFNQEVANPTRIDLRSPWDLAVRSKKVYIAMAGLHQIWIYQVEDQTLTVAAGNGREALFNSSLRDSELAQPSGLYITEDKLLYFADSESSSIRVADFPEDEVRTVSGPAANSLFDFGDVDGETGTSRLQHPLGITGTPEGLLYVADTYNSKIKVLDPETTEIQTAYGLGGYGGFQDGGPNEAAFDEPGGLSYADGKLYVADTNNHVIRVIDLETQTVSTVSFANPEALILEESEVVVAGGNEAMNVDRTLDTQTAAPGESEIVLNVTLPEGFKINDLVESTAVFSTDSDVVSISDDARRVVIDDDTRTVSVPVTLTGGDGTIFAELTLYYCRTGQEALCFIDTLGMEAPVTVEAGGEAIIQIPHEIVPPDGI